VVFIMVIGMVLVILLLVILLLVVMVTMVFMVICTMIVTVPVWPSAMMSAPKYDAESTSGTSSSSAPPWQSRRADRAGRTVVAETPEDKYMILQGFKSRFKKQPKVLKLGVERRRLWFNSLGRKTTDVLKPWNFRNLITISAASG